MCCTAKAFLGRSVMLAQIPQVRPIDIAERFHAARDATLDVSSALKSQSAVNCRRANERRRAMARARSAAPNEKVILQAFWMRLRKVLPGLKDRSFVVGKCDRPRFRGRGTTMSAGGIRRAGERRAESTFSFFHPSQPVGVFFDGKDLASVLLHASIALPDAASFAWILERRAEVRCSLLAEGLLKDLQVLAIPAGD